MIKPIAKFIETCIDRGSDISEYLHSCLMSSILDWMTIEKNHSIKVKALLDEYMRTSVLKRKELEEALHFSAFERLFFFQDVKPEAIPCKKLNCPLIIYYLSNAPFHAIENLIYKYKMSESSQKQQETFNKLTAAIEPWVFIRELSKLKHTYDSPLNLKEDSLEASVESSIIEQNRICLLLSNLNIETHNESLKISQNVVDSNNQTELQIRKKGRPENKLGNNLTYNFNLDPLEEITKEILIHLPNMSKENIRITEYAAFLCLLSSRNNNNTKNSHQLKKATKKEKWK